MKKLLAIGIIVLFVGASVLPSINGNFNKMTETNNPICFDDNLIGCWHFDEGSGNIAHDSSGHNNNGTIYGASWVGGISGKALWFDGIDDFIQVLDTSDFEFVNQSFTFLTWVKILDNIDVYRMFICIGDTHVPPVVYLGKCRSNINDGKIIFTMLNNDYEQTICSSINDGDALPKNQWMHVVGVADYENSSINLYINGILQESQSIIDINLSDSQNLKVLFGNYSRVPEYNEHNHYGVLDEVYIYDRALTGEEILDYFEEFYPVETVYVDDDYNESTSGWGYDRFDSIPVGIDAVNESGTVYVYNGTYNEKIRINKIISLIGEDKENCIIDGSGFADVIIRIYADDVNISGFTVQNSQGGYSGICTYADRTNISNNIVKLNSYHGITVRGLDWEGWFNIISNNIICNNGHSGINIDDSGGNIILNNIISENDVQGIRIEFSIGNLVQFNLITQNLDDGIALNYYSDYNMVIDNYIYENVEDGIQIYESSNNTIMKNKIIKNNETGVQITENSFYNQLYHNNIINNTANAVDECGGIWNITYPSGGNYWSDYWGYDLYSGPDQDIPGSDGIGDVPYEIPCEHGTDYYPLMNPFEMYYVLDIEVPAEVNEEDMFNAVVRSLGGTVIPNATVEFNDELKLTDSDGRVYFTTPQVEEDTYYDIIASKEGYTGDTDTILVKDIPTEFVSCFILGLINNLTTGGDTITFEARNIRIVTFFPFTLNAYTSGELITISKDYLGIITPRFIFAFCGLTYQPSSKISMNKFSQDDSANKIIWLVADVEGNPLRTKDVETMLLNESGDPQHDAEITFNEVNVEGYINPGDTFTVIAPSDDYYVFMLTHKISGATIYKSSLTHY